MVIKALKGSLKPRNMAFRLPLRRSAQQFFHGFAGEACIVHGLGVLFKCGLGRGGQVGAGAADVVSLFVFPCVVGMDAAECFFVVVVKQIQYALGFDAVAAAFVGEHG